MFVIPNILEIKLATSVQNIILSVHTEKKNKKKVVYIILIYIYIYSQGSVVCHVFPPLVSIFGLFPVLV